MVSAVADLSLAAVILPRTVYRDAWSSPRFWTQTLLQSYAGTAAIFRNKLSAAEL